MTADRHGCITTYEEISLSMMIKREGVSAEKRSSSLPEARGISVRRLREIMRHSEMLTKSSSWIWCLAPLVLLTHCICSVQFSSSFFFFCLKWMLFKCYRFRKNTNPLTSITLLQTQFQGTPDHSNEYDMQPHLSPCEKESCIHLGL